jgi:type II secretory pathway pseudopilin PulG
MNNRPSIINHQSLIGNGFTLIEIMLVVVITMIIAGVAIPKFKGSFKSTQMTDAVRSTVRIARYARSLSILQQETCTLRFETNRLVLVCGTNTLSPAASRNLPDDITVSSFRNLNEEAADREARAVRFYPAGMNDGFKLTLSADGGRRTEVECQPISGKVTVTEASR